MKKRIKAGTSRSAAAGRRALFVEAYIANGGNATQAALTAGFSPRSASSRGHELVKDRETSAAIKVRQEALQKEHGVTTDRVLRELAAIAFSDIRQLYDDNGLLKPIKDWPEGAARAVAGMESLEQFTGSGKDRVYTGELKKLKIWDKNAGLEKAMKHLGMFEKDNAQKPLLSVVTLDEIDRAA